MGDIVDQMTKEMNLTPSMMDSMQQQQYSHQQQQPGCQPTDQHGFNSMTPEQQMQLMQQMQGQPGQQGQQPPQQYQQPPQQYQQPPQQYQQPPEYDQPDDVSEASDSVSNTSAEMNLDKLGLNGKSGGFADNIMAYLKDPLMVVVLFIILNLAQLDNVLKPMLPMAVNAGFYYLLIKSLIAGVSFFLTKLVIV